MFKPLPEFSGKAKSPARTGKETVVLLLLLLLYPVALRSAFCQVKHVTLCVAVTAAADDADLLAWQEDSVSSGRHPRFLHTHDAGAASAGADLGAGGGCCEGAAGWSCGAFSVCARPVRHISCAAASPMQEWEEKSGQLTTGK